jgi:hypothetical protein
MNKHIEILIKSIGKSIPAMLPLFLLVFAVSCDNVNTIHQKYIDRGEIIYTGAVDSLKAYPGYEKIRFTWELNADPRITKTIIYWNQREDSVVVNVNRTQSGVMQMSYDLVNIPEGDYIFELMTRDDYGHRSMMKEIVSQVYGDSYVGTLRNRAVNSITKRQSTGVVTVNWEALSSNEIQYVMLYYTEGGVEKSLRVENSETKTELTGIGSGDKLSVVTTYLPTDGLDFLEAIPRVHILPEFELYKGDFAAVVLAGDNTSVNGDRNLARIWDGAISNPGILHTVENATGFNAPHHFTFDMGTTSTLTHFHLWPRTDAGSYSGHSPRFFEVWATAELKGDPADTSYWTTDAWKADWKIVGDYEIINDGSADTWRAGWDYAVDTEEIAAVRYIRLVMKSPNWQNSNCVNIGEITFWGNN